MIGNVRGLGMDNLPRYRCCQEIYFSLFLKKKSKSIQKCFGISKNWLFQKSVGLFVLFVSFIPNNKSIAQSDIPVGSWRFHLSHLDAGFLEGDERTVFFYGTESISFFSIDDFIHRAITKLDGLYGQSFTTADFDPASKLFLVAYPDGTLDVVGEKSIKPIFDLRDNSQILDKAIRKIKIYAGSVFLMADFGFAHVDLVNGRFLDAFLNIGPEGSTLPVLDMSMDVQSIYLTTKLGILKGEKSKNLKDFRNWELMATSVEGGFREMEEMDGKFFTIGADQQLYLIHEGQAEAIIGASGIQILKKIGPYLYFVQNGNINKLAASGSFSVFYEGDNNGFTDYHVSPKGVFLSVPGKGIFLTGENKFIDTSGPQTKIQKFIWTASGIFGLPYFLNVHGNSSVSERNKSSKHVEGRWESVEIPENTMDMMAIQDLHYFATNGDGLWREQNGVLEKLKLDGNNEESKVWTLAKDAQNQLWVGFGDNQERLIKIKTNGMLQLVPVPGLKFAFKILTDQSNNLWILQAPPGGPQSLRVFNELSGLNRTLGIGNNQGALPQGALLDMDLDQDGNLWLGMGNGVVYLPRVSGTTIGSAINAVQPLFENRNLLNGQTVTSVKVAPDQTKWFGTLANGLWHFNEFGNGLLAHFTTENSPLPSNTVRNLTLERLTGELFLVVPNGALSYRGGSIKAFESLEFLKIFPNPVRPDFAGYLSIEGLTDFANIKISNVGGKMVYSAKVRGGKATWNLLNGEGGKLSPGVYLVYVIGEGGSERVAGKFVVL